MSTAVWQETVAAQKVPSVLEQQGQVRISEHVPARVCRATGERLFAPKTVARLQHIVWEQSTLTRVVEPPVVAVASLHGQGATVNEAGRREERAFSTWHADCSSPQVDTPQGGLPMETQQLPPPPAQGLCRRELLTAGLAAGATLTAWPLSRLPTLWGVEAGPPKRGGILRVRGYDPPHFDHHLTINFKTNTTLSFVYSKLVRHRVGPEIRPGTFIVEPDLAERWEVLDHTTYIFSLRQGVTWHNKPPLNGREVVAEDVKFTYDRFLTEKGNADRYMLEAVDRVEVLDRYRVKFLLKAPFAWRLDVLATPRSMWGIAPEVVQQFGALKRPEAALGTGPFTLERDEPNVKTVCKRHPAYFRTGQPSVDGVAWLVLEDDSTGLAMYRTGQVDCGPWHQWAVRQPDLAALKQSPPTAGPRISSPTGRWCSTGGPTSPPAMMCGCAVPSPMPSIGRGAWRAWGAGASRAPPSRAGWSSGRCLSRSWAQGPSTISTSPRRPGACWRRPGLPGG
jgi:Bacterial extracellular solute-binding proteins, family 5 Middle